MGVGAHMKVRWLLMALHISVLVPVCVARPYPSNHLSGATSAYLKRASEQPVDWYPWSAEVWERARKLGRPLLIDVGAIWCSWCQLMDRDSYTRPETAAFINANFVAIKVDYDTQPALAARLERAQAVLNLPSGVPLTLFATPSGKLYFGGTYFPRQASKGKPAFEEVLKQALLMYRDQRGNVEHDGFDLNSGE